MSAKSLWGPPAAGSMTMMRSCRAPVNTRLSMTDPARGRADLRPRERLRDGRAEHGRDVVAAEALLERVEREPRQLGLDEVRAVRHDGLEPLVPHRRLPRRHQVEHVAALGGHAGVLAGVAREADLELRKDGQPRDGVLDLEQARVEGELRGEGRDADERRDADEQQRRDRLVEEVLGDVGGLLEDDDVAARPLGRACARSVSDVPCNARATGRSTRGVI